MIDLRSLKDEAVRFSEPLRSIIQLSNDRMSEAEFLEVFLKWRRKAREMDGEQK